MKFRLEHNANCSCTPASPGRQPACHERVFRTALGCIQSLLLLSAAGLASATTPFVFEVADSTSGAGMYSSLALNAKGEPRISYTAALPSSHVRLASKVGDSWRVELVDSVGGVFTNSSLALDDQDNPHLAYINGDVIGEIVWYASKQLDGDWTRELAAWVSGGGGVSGVCLALDRQGIPNISYYDVTHRTVRFARKVSGSWLVETVDVLSGGDVTSIALDNRGNPWVSYIFNNGEPSSELRVARRSGGTWVHETVDLSPTIDDPSIAIDALGNPCVSYFGGASDLKFAGRMGGGWTVATIDTTGKVGRRSSLALNANGDPWISYGDWTSMHLKLATRSGGVWSTELVDSQSHAGQTSCIRLDVQGNPSISYLEGVEEELRYADSAIHVLSPRGGERWAARSMQPVHWTGAGTISIELSKDGGASYSTVASAVSGGTAMIGVPEWTTEAARVRISRTTPLSISESPGTFSIAPGLDSPWWNEIVRSSGVAGNSSLALDANGGACISFYDSTAADLMFARWAGGQWTCEPVDTNGDVGSYSSLALDAEGNPSIAYVDATRRIVKYARKTDTGWVSEDVDPSPGYGLARPALALDGFGNPMISYVPDNIWMLARKGGSTWSFEFIAQWEGWASTSLAVNAQGQPWTSAWYSTWGNCPGEYGWYLSVATKSTTTWTQNLLADVCYGDVCSLVLDAAGDPLVAYNAGPAGAEIQLARKTGGAWRTGTVIDQGALCSPTALKVGADGEPRIVYADLQDHHLKLACKRADAWLTETIDPEVWAGFGTSASLAMDAQGNACVSYCDRARRSLKFASSGLRLRQPTPGTVWPVGASRTVTWNGTGPVDLYLSTDAGLTWQIEAQGLSGGSHRLIVPHAPSRFAQLKVERGFPYAVSVTPGLFTIETAIELLNFTVGPNPGGNSGVLLSWRTDPGPEALAGFKLEKKNFGEEAWRVLVALTRETQHVDAEAAPGASYRLSAINGLGMELLLGESSFAPVTPLAAWPLPYRGGSLTVAFATKGGWGGGPGAAEVALYDTRGRLVRSLTRGSYAAGGHFVTWDGKDATGAAVTSGVYFLRNTSGGDVKTLKVVVTR